MVPQLIWVHQGIQESVQVVGTHGRRHIPIILVFVRFADMPNNVLRIMDTSNNQEYLILGGCYVEQRPLLINITEKLIFCYMLDTIIVKMVSGCYNKSVEN